MTLLLLAALLGAPADPFAACAEHGLAQQAALRGAKGVLDGWWAVRDPATSLLPNRVDDPTWTVNNAAADLFPFMVLTAQYVAPERLPELLVTLRNELALTTRVGALPDHWSFRSRGFTRSEPDLANIIFSAAEYSKDGLLPMCELLGRGVWFERMQELTAGIFEVAPIETPYGRLPAADTEVNGETLQVLSRLWWATHDRRYLQWATRIGEAYCFEVLPRNNHLPAHVWDFAAHKPAVDRFSLNDHGNEIVLGLAEWFAALDDAYPARAQAAEPALRAMFDTLLERGRNADGLWYALLQPSTGAVLNEGTPDTWGYALCGVYTFGLTVGEPKYLDAVASALAHLNQPRYHKWGGADAFADSIESGLLLLNRVPEPAGFAWLATVCPPFWAYQQTSGIVEGWYGDGNSARTDLMIAMYHAQGARQSPWRPDLRLGAVRDGEAVLLELQASEAWSGRLHFDYPRHREHLGLPVDYPRLNQFPEWFTVERTGLYTVERVGDEAPLELRVGEELVAGLPLELPAAGRLRLRVEPYGRPPFGGRVPSLAGPDAVGAEGAFEVALTLANPLERPLRFALATDAGTVEPAETEVPAGGVQAVTLRGTVEQETAVQVTATPREPWLAAAHTVRILIDPLLVGYLDLTGDGSWAGETYAWSGNRPIEVELPARPGRAHQLVLRWGAKGDQRRGRVTFGATVQEVARGGYDGYENVTLEVPAEAVTGDRLRVRIDPPADGPAAFCSEIRLRLAP